VTEWKSAYSFIKMNQCVAANHHDIPAAVCNQSCVALSKDVPQFAPNFTVYVLPPDVVCLYSEDRKFFLHGELYCALATAIGKGGKAFSPEIVRELEEFSRPTRSRKRSSG
jgi:hypothetical protein